MHLTINPLEIYSIMTAGYSAIIHVMATVLGNQDFSQVRIIDLEIFAVKVFSLPHTATKINIAKYFQLRIIKQTEYLRYEILQNAWQRSTVEYRQIESRGTPYRRVRVRRDDLLSIILKFSDAHFSIYCQ